MGQSVITPWDRLKKHIFQEYPRCTIDPSEVQTEDDYLRIASDYSDKDDMVWIVKSDAKVREDFPWHFRPSDLGRNFIHYFPKTTKRSSVLLNGVMLL